MTETIALLDVTIVIAVSETGEIACCPWDNRNLQMKYNHEQFIQSLRDHQKLWAVKTIKTTVPMPVQFEVIE